MKGLTFLFVTTGLRSFKSCGTERHYVPHGNPRQGLPRTLRALQAAVQYSHSTQLLLRKSGDVTPLLHAMRIGNKDIAIILIGAFSRYVNHLDDSDSTLR